MGEWHEIAHKRKGVIADLKAEIERLKKSYEHDHQLCLDQAAIVIEANTEVNELRAERNAAYLEIQRLKLDDILHAPFCCTDCDYETNIEVNLEAHCALHAAYLKGLEEAQKITARHVFKIGTLEYRNFEAVEAIQSKIDEAKGKSAKIEREGDG